MNNDLISRSALLRDFSMPWDYIAPYLARKIIKGATAVDAEVVRHGRWEHGMQCPYCKQIDLAKPNYCPNCGAKMMENRDV